MLAGPDVPQGLDGPVTGAANALVQTGVLGALVVLLAVAVVLVVWRWNKTNEARVKDQKEMAQTLLKTTTSLNSTLGALVGTTDALKEALKANTSASVTMERTVNEVIRDAVRGSAYRRSSTPTGTPVVPPTSKG
jgi:hypothetical protein